MKKNFVGTLVYFLSLVVILFATTYYTTPNEADPFVMLSTIFGLFILSSLIFGWWLYKNGYTGYGSTALTQSTDTTPLTDQERLVFVVTSLIFSPVLIFTVVYFLWMKRYGGKIKQAEKLFWVTLPIWIVIQFALGKFFPSMMNW